MLNFIKRNNVKSLFVISICFYFGATWASGNCKNRAQTAVEIREDYKNLDKLKDDLILRRSRAEVLSGAGYAREMGDIEGMRLYGQMVFNQRSGGNGTKS